MKKIDKNKAQFDKKGNSYYMVESNTHLNCPIYKNGKPLINEDILIKNKSHLENYPSSYFINIYQKAEIINDIILENHFYYTINENVNLSHRRKKGSKVHIYDFNKKLKTIDLDDVHQVYYQGIVNGEFLTLYVNKNLDFVFANNKNNIIIKRDELKNLYPDTKIELFNDFKKDQIILKKEGDIYGISKENGLKLLNLEFIDIKNKLFKDNFNITNVNFMNNFNLKVLFKDKSGNEYIEYESKKGISGLLFKNGKYHSLPNGLNDLKNIGDGNKKQLLDSLNKYLVEYKILDSTNILYEIMNNEAYKTDYLTLHHPNKFTKKTIYLNNRFIINEVYFKDKIFVNNYLFLHFDNHFYDINMKSFEVIKKIIPHNKKMNKILISPKTMNKIIIENGEFMKLNLRNMKNSFNNI